MGIYNILSLHKLHETDFVSQPSQDRWKLVITMRKAVINMTFQKKKKKNGRMVEKLCAIHTLYTEPKIINMNNLGFV